jgi:hypothetical protein
MVLRIAGEPFFYALHLMYEFTFDHVIGVTAVLVV